MIGCRFATEGLQTRVVLALCWLMNAPATPPTTTTLRIASYNIHRCTGSDGRHDPDRVAAFCGRWLRRIGPMLPEHRIGRENLKAAFPDKPADEIEGILCGSWENLGRLGAEFAHLDRLWDYDPVQFKPGRIEILPEDVARFIALRDDGKPALIFTAHLANWELPALVAARYGLAAHVLYRRPNIGAISDAVLDIRAGAMGTMVATGLDAPGRLVDALS